MTYGFFFLFKGRSPVDARGGQLEIAGVVVGSWGPNLHGAARGRASNMAPQVMSVGGPGKRYYNFMHFLTEYI